MIAAPLHPNFLLSCPRIPWLQARETLWSRDFSCVRNVICCFARCMVNINKEFPQNPELVRRESRLTFTGTSMNPRKSSDFRASEFFADSMASLKYLDIRQQRTSQTGVTNHSHRSRKMPKANIQLHQTLWLRSLLNGAGKIYVDFSTRDVQWGTPCQASWVRSVAYHFYIHGSHRIARSGLKKELELRNGADVHPALKCLFPTLRGEGYKCYILLVTIPKWVDRPLPLLLHIDRESGFWPTESPIRTYLPSPENPLTLLTWLSFSLRMLASSQSLQQDTTWA